MRAKLRIGILVKYRLKILIVLNEFRRLTSAQVITNVYFIADFYDPT